MKRLLAALALATACAAPRPHPDLAEAERLRRAGDRDGALVAYRRAQESCHRERDALRRRATCAEAYNGHAELLVDLGRIEQAIEAFDRAARALAAESPAAAARAVLRSGQLRLDRGDDVAAYQRLWHVVTSWPDEAFAADALKVLLRDGRARDPDQLYQVLAQLDARIGTSEIGDNLLWAMADLAEHEREEPGLARSHLDRLIATHPKSGLVDDSRWHGARLSRELGDPAGAVERLRALLATREVAWGAGSYFSVWLDDAQLALGRVLRDELRDPAGALAAFEELPRDYPASVYIDDALWERAVTLEGMGQRPRACAALAELHEKHPDSRWELEEAPKKRAALACGGSDL
jgi:tetratricopeptide (TPR) repeat protein